MDIKLLEKLKDAGLPQEGGIMFAHGTRIMHTSDHCYCPRCTGEEYVKEPLLEELIDWCIKKQPNEFSNFTLNHTYVEADGGGGYLWEAYFDGGIDGKNRFYETGKTKKEAVAKLGLALHEEV